MNYTAEKHFASPLDALLSDTGEGGVPWEVEDGSSSARHDTWLLSFIDILAILLTLFVLLLAFQDSEMEPKGEAPQTTGELSPDYDVSLDVLALLFQQRGSAPVDLTVSSGFAMPGEGLLPVDVVATHPVIEIEAPTAPIPQPLAADTAELSLEAQESSEAVRDDEVAMSEGEPPDLPAKTMVQTMLRTIEASQASSNPVDELLEVLEHSKLGDRVEVFVHPGEVNLEISDSILFARGSAALTDEGRTLLKDLAEALSEQPYTLSVEGHTDNIPIETSRYPSNWELSSARAAVVTRKLIEQGIAPDLVRAIGYGATRPLAENNTPEGRARNRRVSFVLQVDVKEGGL